MAPEQAAGQQLDARADVYAAGVVLAEMVSPDGIKSYESRQSVWEGVRSEPAQVPDSPWAPVITRAVARDRERRQNSAHTLIRELEDVTLRVEGAEDLRPYPGLASFTEEDAEYFFGREAEVEQMWRKLEGAPRMLALVGPSGAGKSSFIRAGLFAAAPANWSIAVCTPGNAAIASLGRVMAREMAGDADMVEKMMDFADSDVAVEVMSQWCGQTDHALLVIDQFEELFTQSTLEDQKLFADLLSRCVLDADVHVLISTRDDFLFRCHEAESLSPIYSELTPIGPPVGGALRRALVRPATKCGYRFEDDDLVEQMLAEVEGERGALPLLAFAAAQLWERRDRETGLLTREAYQEIGGVGGALAQHAEATIDRIGTDHIAHVRELFRNLMTAEGTRAVREWNELLSVFDERHRGPAEEVLRKLIDARLLTSYEVREDEHEPTRRVEIIHESLLANWPRLVRWQTQDADAAQLRDQLRQAARTWNEQGRKDDTLWTGATYREFAVWRERYPGGLTDTEQAFAGAMRSLATRRARRRRMAVSASVAILIVGLAVVGSFWQRSVHEAQRAEAANLLSLAQLQESPSETLAYAIASLKLGDNPAVRRLALEALWRGPTEIYLQTNSPYSIEFSPDGRWLATADPRSGGKIWPSDGGPPITLEDSDVAMGICFSPTGDLVASTMDTERRQLGIWTMPEGTFLRSFQLGDRTMTYEFWFSRDGEYLITPTEMMSGEGDKGLLRSWPVGGGEADLIARLPSVPMIGPTEDHIVWADGKTVQIAPMEDMAVNQEALTTVEHDQTIAAYRFDKHGRHLATSDTGGTIRVWSLESTPPKLIHELHGAGGMVSSDLRFHPSGQMLASAGGFLWDLAAPKGAEPFWPRGHYGFAFHPNGSWYAATGGGVVRLLPLNRPIPRILRGHENSVYDAAYTPDGKRLVSVSEDLTVRVWPLGGDAGEQSRVIYKGNETFEFPLTVAMAPNGSFVVIGDPVGNVRVIPLDGGTYLDLEGFSDVISRVAVGPQNRFVAAGAGAYILEESVVRVWDLQTEDVEVLDAGDLQPIDYLKFTGESELWVASGPTLRRWRFDGESPQIKQEFDLAMPDGSQLVFDDLGPDEKQGLLHERSGERRLWTLDIESHEARVLESHHDTAGWARFASTGEIILSADRQAEIRVGRVTDEQPHLLLGHEKLPATWAGVSPDGKWIASTGNDSTIRLWPKPDLSEPPLHTIPRAELVAKLETLTNLRAVRDESSSTGWKIEIGPFPGWETVPTW
jgi:WD40 repeat protein